MEPSAKEYQKGILSWEIDANATLRTATSQFPGGFAAWSDLFRDPIGSKVQSPAYRHSALALASIDDRSALDSPFQVRWERLVDLTVLTFIWDRYLSAPSTRLLHLPGYGTFHRLVVATPYEEVNFGQEPPAPNTGRSGVENCF